MAGIAAIVDSLESVPEALRDLYEEREGKFHLSVDGAPSPPQDSDDVAKLRSALDNERKSRAGIEKAMKDLRAQFADVDPEKAREAMKTLAELEEKNLLGEGKFEEAVEKRVERMKADYETKLQALTADNGTLTGRLEELLIDNSIRAAATKAGVVGNAVDDAVLFGKTVWKLKDGNPVPMNGEEIVFGKSGKEPMTVEEWIAERAEDRPHWFGKNSGGGALGSGEGSPNGFSISREDARNPAAYRAAFEQAQKQGAELTITE